MTKRSSWFSAAARGDAADIVIFSEIGGFGVGAQQFYDQLKALGKPSEIHIAISSDGGDISTGFAIFNMLVRHPAHKVVTIEGLAASMASVVAMAGELIIMPDNAMMMIHNPWGAVIGGSDEILSFGEALKTMKTNIARAYTKRTGIPVAAIKGMMDRETWLSAQDAVAKGFADRIEKPMVALNARATFNLNRFSHVPAKFGRTLKETKMVKAPELEVDGEEESGVKQPTTAEIRAELLAYQSEVRAICKLAGRPDDAEEFIAADKPVKEVVAALEAKREEDAKKAKGGKKEKEVSAHNNPRDDGVEPAEINTPKIYAKWNSAGRK